MRRRDFVTALSAGTVVGLAGCAGDGNGSGTDEPDSNSENGNQATETVTQSEQDEVQFRGNIAEYWVSNAPGGTQDQYARVWATNAERHYPDHISTNLAHHVGADGLLKANRFADLSDPDNVVTLDRHNTLIANSFADQSRFDLSSFRALNWVYPSTRGIQVNPRTTDVTDHWDWDWDTFIDRAPDMTFGGTGPHQLIFKNALETFEPRLNEGDIEVVLFGGGSEARAAIQRGDLDGYMGGYSSNRSEGRTDFYKTQFAIADSSYPDLVRQIREIDPDAQVSGDGMDEENARRLTDIVYDPTGFFIHSDASDEAHEVHLSALEATATDEQLEQQIEDMMGTLTLNHSTVVGEQAEQAFQNKIDLLEEFPAIIPDL